ncbi:MAG: polysaccharide deacetylase family protein [Oscillospiraceae bacterium]|nr:polysaccharide deacetylase family protein [Oscillospiraceae bacterium]
MYVTLRLRAVRALALLLCAGALAAILSLPGRAVPAGAQAEAPRTVYLTFDDGPSLNTPGILDALARNGVPATFFVTGQAQQCFPCIARAAAEGHMIALHTYSHEFSEIYASSEAFWLDIDRLQALIIEQTGAPATALRFAGGSSNSVSRRYGGRELMRTLCAQCAQRGLTYYDWNVDTRDSESGVKSADYIAQRAVRGALKQTDAVILMHDGALAKNTAEAIDILVPALREQGCSFARLDGLAEPVHHTLS